MKLITEGHVAQNDWHIFSNYRGAAKTFVFFTASRTHFYIQPEGLWQIMCQGFMMWDVIGPPSWWSKWMCISQWHPHICLAANEHASHGVSHSHWPNSLCNFVHLQMWCLSKHHFQRLHSYRVTAVPTNTTLTEKWHHATRMYFPDKNKFLPPFLLFKPPNDQKTQIAWFNNYVKQLLTGWLIYSYAKEEVMELSVNILNDTLPFRMEDLFSVSIANSLGGKN